MNTPKRRTFVLLAATLLAVQLATGCGKKSSSSGGGAPPPSTNGSLVFVIQPVGTTPGATLASFTVEVRDTSNVLIGTATNLVTINFQNNAGAGILSGTVSKAAVNGTATFDNISINNAGTGYTLNASTPGFSTGISASFNIISNSATQLVITTQPPSSAAAHEGFTVVVEARTAGGAVDTSFTGPVTIAIAAQPAGDLLVHASGLGTPILELIDAGQPAVTASIIPTFDLLEVFGMVYDPALQLVRVTTINGEFVLLDPSTGDCASYGGTSTMTEFIRGMAFNGQGQIRALSPYNLGVYTIDLVTGVDSSLGTSLTLSGFTPDSCTGMDRHPSTGVFHGVLRDSSGSFAGRPLVTINMGSGVCTLVGDTGENIAGLTFAPDGTLYGVSGDGSLTPSTLFTVDTSDGSLTTLLALGNGDDGESIAYVPRRLMGTVTVNAVAGVATFDALSIDQAGLGYTLTVTAGGLTPDTTTAVDVSGTVTPTATVEFPTPSSVVDENISGGFATVTLQLSAPQAHNTPVMIFIDSASPAAALADHTQPLAFQVIIPAGQSTVDFTIPIVDDAVAEGDEDIILVISGAALASGFGTNTTHTLTILNDD